MRYVNIAVIGCLRDTWPIKDGNTYASQQKRNKIQN